MAKWSRWLLKKFVGEQPATRALDLAQNGEWLIGNYTLTGQTAVGCYGIDGCRALFFEAPKEVNPLAKGLYIGGGLLETAGGTCLVTASVVGVFCPQIGRATGGIDKVCKELGSCCVKAGYTTTITPL